MSDNAQGTSNQSQLELELYFLIARFLSAGPCKQTATILLEELKKNELLPKRVDWEGSEHFRSYENLHHDVTECLANAQPMKSKESRNHLQDNDLPINMYKHVAPNHLLQICERIGPILDKEIPSNVDGVGSLLGAGRQSLLRTKESLQKVRWPMSTHTALKNHAPLLPPIHMASTLSVVKLQMARDFSGLSRFDQLCSVKLYNKCNLLSRSLGHLSAVYCVTFDRTGEFIITGADDHLVKIWSAVSGRLLATLRGFAAEITDIAVSYDNKLLACGSCDKTVRVWNLKNAGPVAILHGHSGMITSIQFCPMPKGELRYLASTGSDGGVCFWSWNIHTKVFNTKPVKFIEKSRAGAQMLCSAFSPGGVFLATGNSDSVIRVYAFGAGTFEKICELEAHSDRVDSIQYSNKSTKFVSGSKDGSARIWRYERQQWKNVVLNMAYTVPGQISLTDEIRSCSSRPRVSMVAWSCDDEYLVTAVTDLYIKVWNSHTGKLVHCLKGHQDEMFVLEQNPVDSRIMLSAGHDGYILIWDILMGTQLKQFTNNIQGQGHGAVFDCKWAPDGQSFACTDSHGFLRYFGFGTNERYKVCPEDQFFHTDYRPLIRDSNDYVLDEQTQQPPHLMPPAFLVNLDGNPHPSKFQRLVPGRESSKEQHLVPQMGITPSGDREVLDDTRPIQDPPAGRADQVDQDDPAGGPGIIDHMIERMQREQDERILAAGGEILLSPTTTEPLGSPLGSPRSCPSLVHPSEEGSAAGGTSQPQEEAAFVYQQSKPLARNISVWNTRVCVRAMDKHHFKKQERLRQAFMDEEVKHFLQERKKKPLPPSGNESSESVQSVMLTRKKQQARSNKRRVVQNEETAQNRLTRMALYDTEVEEEEDEDEGAINIPSDEGWQSEASQSDSSSEYSDWAADGGVNLQPPKRRSERQPKQRKFSTSEEEEEEEEVDGEEDTDVEEMRPDDEQEVGSESETEGRSRRRSSRRKGLKNHRKAAQKAASSRIQMRDARRIRKKRQTLEVANVTELKEEFRPPEWLSDSIPRKTPYFPQMGDELIYLRQGHEEYVKAVQKRNLYEISNNNQPWSKNPHLKDHELVKVVGIKYEFKKGGNGIRLVCLKLSFIERSTGKLSGGSFTSKYHDVADVLDFLVLRQSYDTAMRRKWKPGDRFRSMIDDAWWFGTILSQVPFQEGYPESMFLCYNVKWDNGESERMSPWDFEPISKKQVPANTGGSIPVNGKELKVVMHVPKETEWPIHGQDVECQRLVQGLEQIMELSIAEPFLAPVDLQAFPLYAMIIEYPVDLSLIKARLENRFYRRVTSVQFDVRYVELNAKAFNRPGTEIVQKAKLVTELCLRLISNVDCTDIMPMYNELVKDTEFIIRDSDAESAHSGYSVPQSRSRRTSRIPSTRSLQAPDPDAWHHQCTELLQVIYEHDDSGPFRNAVDPNLYPEYYQTVEHPMDFGTIKEQLESRSYSNPNEFTRDCRLVFKNSRLFNTNKRSRIYAMTLRLSFMFEDQIKSILREYEVAISRTSRKGKSSSRLPAKVSRLKENARRTLQESPSKTESTSLTRPGTSKTRSGLSGIQESSASAAFAGTTSSRDSQGTRRSLREVKRHPFFSESENEGESDKENKSDSDTEENSEYESQASAKGKASRKIQPKRSATSSARKRVNGSTRYSTRTQTGSAKRKNYTNFSDDEEDTATKQARKKSRRNLTDEEEEEAIGDNQDPIAVDSGSNTDVVDSDHEDIINDRSSEEEESDDSDDSSKDSDSIEVPESPVRVGRRVPPPLVKGGGSRAVRTPRGERSPGRHLESGSSRRAARKSGVSYEQYFDEEEEEDHPSSSSRRSTRNQGRQRIRYDEDSEDEAVSVSSRGRVRKMNSRMREYLGD